MTRKVLDLKPDRDTTHLFSSQECWDTEYRLLYTAWNKYELEFRIFNAIKTLCFFPSTVIETQWKGNLWERVWVILYYVVTVLHYSEHSTFYNILQSQMISELQTGRRNWKSSGVKRFDTKYFRLSRHDFKMQIGYICIYEIVRNILSSRKHWDCEHNMLSIGLDWQPRVVLVF